MRLAATVAIAMTVIAAGGVTRSDPAEEPAPAVDLAPRRNIAKVDHRPGGEAPVVGPSDALVTIELFFVAGAQPTRGPFEQLRELQAAHPSRIRLVFRVLQRGGNLLAPVAALEAEAQGKFFEFMSVLVKKNNVRREQLLEMARQVGLDTTRLAQAWDDDRHEAALLANESRRRRLHAGNTLPSAAFNSEMLVRPIAGLEAKELEEPYLLAYDRALDKLDRGVPIDHLGQAFDREALAAREPQTLAPGPIDDPDPDAGAEAVAQLVTVPLDTRGWPSSGPADADVTVVVLCNLRTVACRTQLVERALTVAGWFDDQVRIVWAPMFDPAADDAAATTMINDAALCAEELGAGWSWVEQAAQAAYRRHGKPTDPDKEIDDVIKATDLDSAAVARCLASGAGASARAVARIRASGVKSGPSLVVGGRVYPGGVGDARMLQGLVEDELAPGILEDLVPDWSSPR
jgi:predicted DsbA family dithiol-disulfide isomerase